MSHANLMMERFAIKVTGPPVMLQNSVRQAIGKIIFNGLTGRLYVQKVIPHL
jgi:hypothetical protein